MAVIVAPVVGLGLMTGGCGIGIPRCCKAPAVFAIPPRTPGSVCARADAPDTHRSTAVQIAKVRKFLMTSPFPPQVPKSSHDSSFAFEVAMPFKDANSCAE